MFKKLTPRQKLSLKHLKEIGIIEPLQIIEWAVNNLNKPSQRNHLRNPSKRIPGPYRRHTKKHYQDIIDYLAQGGEI